MLCRVLLGHPPYVALGLNVYFLFSFFLFIGTTTCVHRMGYIVSLAQVVKYIKCEYVNTNNSNNIVEC